MLEIEVPSYVLEYEKKLLRKVLLAAGKEIAATAKGLLTKAGSGRKYGKHTASSPGQPPSTRSGTLAKGFNVTVGRYGDAVTIRDIAYYAKALEGGSRGGGGGKNSASIGRSHKRGGAKGTPQTVRMMAPRPFLSLAVKQDWAGIAKRIKDSVSDDFQFKKKT